MILNKLVTSIFEPVKPLTAVESTLASETAKSNRLFGGATSSKMTMFEPLKAIFGKVISSLS
ncbi:hypothetical protein P4560_02130 [Heyndrickxia sporothermodurans]|uniref:hypothetical protein n=1 Tax=Heyndrickxia sporothermodurans TaxID=46224 RepID=UPI002E22AE66|nr:hypothetical protein [Heyndrickxia sporothermodurans]